MKEEAVAGCRSLNSEAQRHPDSLRIFQNFALGFHESVVRQPSPPAKRIRTLENGSARGREGKSIRKCFRRDGVQFRRGILRRST